MYVVRSLAKKVKHLRKGQRHQKIVGLGGVRNGEENRRFPIPDAVKLQLVIAHNLPELGDVEGGQPGPAAYQDRLGGFAENELSRTFSSEHIKIFQIICCRIIIVEYAISLYNR